MQNHEGQNHEDRKMFGQEDAGDKEINHRDTEAQREARPGGTKTRTPDF
jgi:hypothetical protein